MAGLVSHVQLFSTSTFEKLCVVTLLKHSLIFIYRTPVEALVTGPDTLASPKRYFEGNFYHLRPRLLASLVILKVEWEVCGTRTTSLDWETDTCSAFKIKNFPFW